MNQFEDKLACFDYNDEAAELGIKKALQSEENSANFYDPSIATRSNPVLIERLQEFCKKEKEMIGVL